VLAIECPKCKSKDISEKLMFQFSTTTCPDCGYEYHLNLWYRFTVHVFLWVFGYFWLTFKYFIDIDSAPHWVIYTAIFLLLALPIFYYFVVYYFYRDIPAEKGISKAHAIIFWLATITTFIPAALYTYG